MSTLRALEGAAELGGGTGIRSMSPLAATTWTIATGRVKAPGLRPFGLLSHRAVAAGLTVAAIGEAVLDKTAPLPSRISPLPLGSRIVIGALLGGIVCADERQPILPGVAVGGMAAAAGAFLSFHARKGLVEAGMPDVLAAVLGDTVMVGLTLAALRDRKGALA